MRSSKHFASLLIAVSIIGAALVAAASATPAGDACALLTAAQAGAALGAPVGAGSYITPTSKKTCTWNSTASDGGYVTLLLQDVAGFEGGKQLGQSASKDLSVTSISGVGDDAYYLALGGQVDLIVKKGNVAFKVAVYTHMTVESKEAKEKTLAQQVPAGL
ncbi:MAG: hypothetical protein WA807_02395 [Steroidobacteraceae bacterium]